VANLQKTIEQLQEASSAPDFWSDLQAGQRHLQTLKSLQNRVDAYNGLVREYEDAVTLAEMCIEEREDSMVGEVLAAGKAFIGRFETMRIQTLLSGEYDRCGAIVTLHAGAGGTESCDWVDMLLRMYAHWVEKHGYAFELLDYLPGEEAGVKSVTFAVEGENAYGYLKCEKGVHRLVRISPFDASGRRHTSFASCDVMPEIEDDKTLDINPDDLRVDTYRSSGAGGQHVNKTSSAIRITHIPTGIVVQCQNERSQFQNKDNAMKMLRAKLMEVKRAEQADKLSDIRGEIKDIAWGSQIRSYVFHPYSLAKDHRTNAEMGNIQAVMDGDIDLFINAYLSQSAVKASAIETSATNTAATKTPNESQDA